MEIKFINISNKKVKLKKLNLKISNNKITGILGDTKNIISNLLTNNLDYQGIIMFNNLNILGYDLKKISYIKKIDKNTFLTKLVSDEFYLKKKNVNAKDTIYLEKIISSLKMVGLDDTYLKREIRTLSKSEARLLEISLNLINNPELIIIDEPFLYLDNNFYHNIKKIILDLKEKYKKTIIILSQDTNLLYELTDNVIIFSDNQLLISGKTKTIFKDKEFLKNKNITLPDILLFKELLSSKGIDFSNLNTIDEIAKGVVENVRKTKENKPED